MCGSVPQTGAWCPSPPSDPVPTSVATAARISTAANSEPKTAAVVSSGSVSFQFRDVIPCPLLPQPGCRTTTTPILIEKRCYRIKVKVINPDLHLPANPHLSLAP